MAATALALAAGGCESDVESRLALVALGETCKLNSDCEVLLSCTFERCHEACGESRDCDDGARCVRGKGAHNVCQLEDEQHCDQAHPCPGAQACGVDAICRDACQASADCVGSQVCTTGTCADATELDENGLLPAASGPGIACSARSDCPEGLVCRGGNCEAECRSDRDCRDAQVCRNGACNPAPAGSTCLLPSDCLAGNTCVDGDCVATTTPIPDCRYSSDCTVSGQHCESGKCLCECAHDVDCKAGWACPNGCGCSPSRIIDGDVTVSNDLELRELDDVIEIKGQLSLTLQSSAAFRVPHLRKAGSIDVRSKELFPSVYFDALETVEGLLSCDPSCVAPQLVSVGSLFVHNLFTQREFSLPALTSVESESGIWIDGNPGLKVVRFPNLAQAYGLKVTLNDGLEVLDLPSLVTVTNGLELDNNRALTSVTLPKLATVASVRLAQLPRLTALTLDGLKTAQPNVGTVVITKTGLTSIGSLNLLSALATGGGLTVTDNLALPGCNVDALKDELLKRNPPWSGEYAQLGNSCLSCAGSCP